MVKPSNQAALFLKIIFAILILLIGSYILIQPQFYEWLFSWITPIVHRYNGYDVVQAWRKEYAMRGESEERLLRGLELAHRYPKYLSAEPIQRELESYRRQQEQAYLYKLQEEADRTACINSLKEKALQDIQMDIYEESELWHLFTQMSDPKRCTPMINPHHWDAAAWGLAGAIKINQGIVLMSRRSGDKRWMWIRDLMSGKKVLKLAEDRSGQTGIWGFDWVWTYDRLFRIDRDQRWHEGGRAISSPSEDIQREYEKVLTEWGPKTARLFNDRSHRLYQSKNYAAAKEVIQYALRLDPNYNLAWYNAAAYAALDNDAAKAIEYLRHYAMPGSKLLSKVRLDPDFKKLLASHPEFRHFLYEQAVEKEAASEFLMSFSLELDWSRSIGCDEEEAGEGCEGFKEIHADLVLSRPQKDPNWRLVLQEDTEESQEEIGFVRIVDIGRRFFIVFKEIAYEVHLDPPGLTSLGGAGLISDTNEGFPLVMARRDLDPQDPEPTWDIREYDGKEVIPYGYYHLPSSTLKETSPDELWFIEKGGQGFQIRDLVSGKVYPLVPVSDIKSGP